MGEAVQRDVEDMAAGAFEPGCEATQLVMLFQQQDPVATPRQDIRGGQAAESTSDHDDVVFVLGTFEKIFWHLAMSVCVWLQSVLFAR